MPIFSFKSRIPEFCNISASILATFLGALKDEMGVLRNELLYAAPIFGLPRGQIEFYIDFSTETALDTVNACRGHPIPRPGLSELAILERGSVGDSP
jgi:hypothetical protein